MATPLPLVYMVGELPEMSKGKGVKMINIPSKRLKSGEERVAGVAVFQEGEHLKVHVAKRVLHLKPRDIDHYVGERALRGLKLPRGFRQVRGIEVFDA